MIPRLSVVLILFASGAALAQIPPGIDPHVFRSIETNEPQMFVDDYLVENRYNEDLISARVPHVLHVAERPAEPLITRDEDLPWEVHGLGYAGVVYDPKDELFRLYYQVWLPEEMRGIEGQPEGSYRLCYAESEDGLSWTKPMFDLFPCGESKKTNIVLQGEQEGHAPHIHIDCENDGKIRNIGTLPSEAFRGHRYLMYASDGPHFLSTSDDGIHFQERQQQVLPRRIDCQQTLVYDEGRKEFVTFLRNKMIFSGPRGTPRRANHRMMTRLSSPELWKIWEGMPTSVLIPDAGDDGRFYAMPTFLYGGVYWGLLNHLAQEPMKMEVELVYSRDGFDWNRVPGRPKLISIGPKGTWDSGMVITADRVIEHGDEWWLYYTGYNGAHDSDDRYGSVGLLRFRKEGFVSIQADARGKKSYLVTRPFLWPGGDLVINADAKNGSVRVRVTDLYRNQVEGFSYEDCEAFSGDEIRHRIGWKSGDLNDLKGKPIRLEFEFANADLYAFLASDEGLGEEGR